MSSSTTTIQPSIDLSLQKNIIGAQLAAYCIAKVGILPLERVKAIRQVKCMYPPFDRSMMITGQSKQQPPMDTSSLGQMNEEEKKKLGLKSKETQQQQQQLVVLSERLLRLDNDLMDDLQAIVKDQGFGALWKGLPITCALTISQFFLKSVLYDFFEDQIMPGGPNHIRYDTMTLGDKMWRLVCTGVMANSVSLAALYPFHLAMNREIADVSMGGQIVTDPFSLLSNILAKEGIRGWYKGLFSSLLEIIPFTATFIVTGQTLRPYLSRVDDPQWRSLMSVLFTGISASVAMLIKHPINTITKRLILNKTPGTSLKANCKSMDAVLEDASLRDKNGVLASLMYGSELAALAPLPQAFIQIYTYQSLVDILMSK